MKTWSMLGVGCVGWMLAATALEAQHLDFHGDHFDIHRNVPHGHDPAGHLVDRFGHHIDGHGLHTGSIGVFENGARDYNPYENRWNNRYDGYRSYHSPSYSSPLNYSSSFYSSRLYSAIPNPYLAPGYASPSAVTILTRPTIRIPNIVANRIPLSTANSIPQAIQQRTGSIVLRNPRGSGGSLSYTLNSFTYTINPGESQKIPHDRDWIIRFDNGLGKTVAYRLESGDYEFAVAPQSGWDIARRTEPQSPAPQADAPEELPQNSILDTAEEVSPSGA